MRDKWGTKWEKEKSGAKIKVEREKWGGEKWVTKWGVKSEPRKVG